MKKKRGKWSLLELVWYPSVLQEYTDNVVLGAGNPD